jgi:hypothetical protein
MRRLIFAFLVLMGAMVGGVGISAQTDAKMPVRLNLYVKPLEGPDATLAKSVRSKLIDELTQHGISVIESDEHADAVLSGYGLTRATKCKGTNWGGHSSTCVHAVMRLVNRNGVVLWTEEAASNRYSVNETTSFIDNVTKKTTEAMEEESKRRNSEPSVQAKK